MHFRYVQKSGQTQMVQPMRDVQRKVKRKETVDFKELYNDGRDDTETSLFRSRFD